MKKKSNKKNKNIKKKSNKNMKKVNKTNGKNKGIEFSMKLYSIPDDENEFNEFIDKIYRNVSEKEIQALSEVFSNDIYEVAKAREWNCYKFYPDKNLKDFANELEEKEEYKKYQKNNKAIINHLLENGYNETTAGLIRIDKENIKMIKEEVIYDAFNELANKSEILLKERKEIFNNKEIMELVKNKNIKKPENKIIHDRIIKMIEDNDLFKEKIKAMLADKEAIEILEKETPNVTELLEKVLIATGS